MQRSFLIFFNLIVYPIILLVKFRNKKKKKSKRLLLLLAGEERLELPTDGFGDRYATNCAILLQEQKNDTTH